MFDQLSLNLLDLGMNAITAGAHKVQIEVEESAKGDSLTVRIVDDGRGMDRATLERVLAKNASTKVRRKKSIGLGLALLRQTAEMCEGTFEVQSVPGQGTTVTATMKRSHVDRPPIGDVNATILTLCSAAPDVDVRLIYRSDDTEFLFSSLEGDDQRKNNEPRATQETQRKSPTPGCTA